MSTNRVSTENVVILLGASNLTLGWPRVMQQIESYVAGPRVVLTAHGMGRSYLASRSSFLARQLPGILQSALWQTLPLMNPVTPPLVLITDLGNDLIYGRNPLEVAESARECVARFRDWNPEAKFVVTRPPVSSVCSLGPMRFRFFRKIIFPRCQLSLADAQSQTVELDGRLVDIQDDLNATLIEPMAEWFGADPIHIRRACQPEAFARMMAGWNVTPAEAVSGIRHPRPTAELRWVWGREKITAQPVVNLGETRVFAF